MHQSVPHLLEHQEGGWILIGLYLFIYFSAVVLNHLHGKMISNAR